MNCMRILECYSRENVYTNTRCIQVSRFIPEEFFFQKMVCVLHAYDKIKKIYFKNDFFYFESLHEYVIIGKYIVNKYIHDICLLNGDS